MPRTARLDAPGIFHHVMIRGIEGRNIFRTEQDREDFLRRLSLLLPETDTACYGWAFLDNHCHFLFRTGSTPLSTVMRRLLTGYVVGFNRRHKRQGQLFQNRFKSIVCQEELYLQELVRYIHLNPLRAGLVDDLAELDHYPYCGHSALMGGVERLWQDTEFVLATFGGKRSAARQAYRDYVAEGLPQGSRNDLVGGGLVRSLGGWSEVKDSEGAAHMMSDERILGDSDFVESLLSQADETLERGFELKTHGYDLQHLVERAAEIFDMSIEDVFLPGRQAKKVKVRSLICFWAVKKLGLSQTFLAKVFAMTVPGVGYAVVRGERVARENGLSLDV